MSPSDTLAERYGVRAPWRRRAVIAATTVLAVVFVAWLAWLIWGSVTPQVTSSLETYTIDDDHSVTAVIVVTLHDQGVEATCTVRALASDHTVVGEVSFHPDVRRVRQIQQFRTDRRANSVESTGCTAPGQNRPR